MSSVRKSEWSLVRSFKALARGGPRTTTTLPGDTGGAGAGAGASVSRQVPPGELERRLGVPSGGVPLKQKLEAFQKEVDTQRKAEDGFRAQVAEYERELGTNRAQQLSASAGKFKGVISLDKYESLMTYLRQKEVEISKAKTKATAALRQAQAMRQQMETHIEKMNSMHSNVRRLKQTKDLLETAAAEFGSPEELDTLRKDVSTMQDMMFERYEEVEEEAPEADEEELAILEASRQRELEQEERLTGLLTLGISRATAGTGTETETKAALVPEAETVDTEALAREEAWVDQILNMGKKGKTEMKRSFDPPPPPFPSVPFTAPGATATRLPSATATASATATGGVDPELTTPVFEI